MKLFNIISFLSLIFFCAGINAQIYNKSGQFNYKSYHVKDRNTISQNKVTLVCSGKEWLSPKNSPMRGAPIKDAWSITWSYFNQKKNIDNKEVTGVTQNSEKLFLHPIRMDEYAILEFCPFPMVTYPIIEGKEWTWTLENINTVYYKSIKKHDHNFPKTVKNEYKIEKKVYWNFKQKKISLECYEIKSIGNCSLGKTELITFFSEQYGFVYLKYKTLNDDIYIFELEEVSNNTDKLFKF